METNGLNHHFLTEATCRKYFFIVQGLNCIQKKHCDSNPCKPGYDCVEIGNSYSCECRDTRKCRKGQFKPRQIQLKQVWLSSYNFVYLSVQFKPPEHRTYIERTQEIQKTSWKSSKRLAYIPWTPYVQGIQSYLFLLRV